jgi:hypothetical protein
MSDLRPSQRSPEAPGRPSRPALVELASAVLVVNGAISILASVDVAMRLAEAGPGVEPLALITLGIGVISVVLGLLMRFGRAWLVTLNVVAIAAFLELTSGSIAGLLFGGLDLFVVVVLLLERPWFRWLPDEANGRPVRE